MFNNFELLKIDNPVLRNRAKEVDLDSLQKGKHDALLKIMRMIATKNNYYEVTAPQIGTLLRIVALKLDLSRENEQQDVKNSEVTIMINPKIKQIEGASVSTQYEICTSAKGYTIPVERTDSIFLEYFTPECTKVQIFVHGYTAHLVQHTLEHLDGKNFLVLQDEEQEIIHRHM